MLDAFKGIGGKSQRQAEDLQKLIDTAREERSALSTMLTQVSMLSAKLGQAGKALEQITRVAPGAAGVCRKARGGHRGAAG